MNETPELNDYKRRRDGDPALTVYWIASPELDTQVPLNGLSCIWCKTTIMDHMKGSISAVLNAPVNLDDFTFSGTVRCKLCKQNYRFVIAGNET